MEPAMRDIYAGDVIFSEGSGGGHLYVIKKGQVDISVMRDGKRITLTTLGPGACFGEMAPITGEKRTATATAKTFCELYVVDARALEFLLKKSSPLLRTILHSLIKRLRNINQEATQSTQVEAPIVIYSSILELMGKPNAGDDGKVVLPIADVLERVKTILGHPPFRVRSMIEQLHKFQLIDVQGVGVNLKLAFEPEGLLERARGIAAGVGDALGGGLQAEFELIEVDDLAKLIEVDRGKILKKLSQDEFVDSMFVFRKSEVMTLLEQKGRKFFEKRRIKKVEDFDEIADIEFIDRNTLFAVINKIDTLDLAKLLATIDDPALQERIVAVLPKRKRELLEMDMQGIVADDVEAAQVEERIIGEIKQLKLGGGGESAAEA